MSDTRIPPSAPVTGPSRRAVMTAAAWSAPVVVLAAAAPGAAASNGTPAVADLAVGFSALTGPGVSAKQGPLQVRVYDQNSVGSWTGSFVLTLTLVADDTTLVINTGVSNPAPEVTTVGLWSFSGYSTPLTNGTIGLIFGWTGTIPAGDQAVLTLDPGTSPFGYVNFTQLPGATQPYSTTRTAEISGATGADSPAGNTVTQPITYVW